MMVLLLMPVHPLSGSAEYMDVDCDLYESMHGTPDGGFMLPCLTGDAQSGQFQAWRMIQCAWGWNR